MKVLLLENIHNLAKEILVSEGFDVVHEPKAWTEEQLLEAIDEFNAIGIRSKTHISPKVFDKATNLLAVGCFCIGTDQVQIDYANKKGIPVFNAPYSNTRSVAELVISEMIALSRKLFNRSAKAHKGEWDKSAIGSREVRGKTLGIIGYGHIGSQLSVLAESLGLKVLYYDVIKKLPLGNARSTENLSDLLKESDFVSLHVPDTPDTRGMIGKREIGLMKEKSFLINASRGKVVDLMALRSAILEGKIQGAAVDVFPQEPKSNAEKFSSELQGLNNVILTPHIGGSTEEAQESIGQEVSESLKRFLKQGGTIGATNFPQLDSAQSENSLRILNVHQNVPGVLGEINKIVSELGSNIRSQHLSTDNNIGYLIMDVEKANAQELAQRIGQLSTNIKTRVVL